MGFPVGTLGIPWTTEASRAGCRAWMPTLEFCGFSPEMPHHRLKPLLDHSDIPQELSVEGLFPDPVPVQRCVFGGVIGSGADFMDGQLIPMMGSCCDGRLQVCSRTGWDSTRFATPGMVRRVQRKPLDPSGTSAFRNVPSAQCPAQG